MTLIDYKTYAEFLDKHVPHLGKDTKVLIVDYQSLEEWRPDVAQDVVNNPDGNLIEIKTAVRGKIGKEINVLFRNSSLFISLQDLRTEHLGKLIMINGIASKTMPPRPMVSKAMFECKKCGADVGPETQHGWDILEPSKCQTPKCNSGRFRFLDKHLQTKYIDVQTLAIQEKPEDLEVGQSPRVIDLEIRQASLINKVQAGDIVNVTGILRARPPRNAKKRTWINYFDVQYVDVHNEDPTNVFISEEDEKQIQLYASDKDVYEKIIGSIAPSIYGYDQVKEAIMYQLFGGCEKQFPDRTSRGNIHILWIDDPSTAKSQVLLAAKNISARGIYVSGGGASGAGLTAAVIKVDDGFALEAGAMVLANGGICCIDEIEKMNDEDRKRIHEAMSIQTVNIQKATVHYTLPAKTAILAAGNPAFGRYDVEKSVAENITLLPSILSRFDLIFIGKGDRPDTERDAFIAEYVLENPQAHQTMIPKEMLRKYIAYSRRIQPTMNKTAIEYIKQFYTEMRNLYNSIESQKSPIVITARQLEGLRRISEAHARIRLSNVVEEEDVIAAITIMKESLKQAGIDPETGKFDIDAIMGTPKSTRDKMSEVLDLFKGHRTLSREEIYEQMRERGVSERDTANALRKLVDSGNLHEPTIGVYGVLRHEY